MKKKIFYSLFALTTLLSSFLLFLVQPIIAKYLLPTFGGSASVWTIAMLFFQLLLFAGYYYSYRISLIDRVTQKYIHLTLVLLVLFVNFFISKNWLSPILPTLQFNNLLNIPELNLIFLLIVGVGLFYFILSTTSTLSQYWFSQLGSESPYWLYRISNLGSFAALVAYPFLLEPNFILKNQGRFFYISFLIYCVFLTIIVIFIKQKKGVPQNLRNKTQEKINLPHKKYLIWITLSALPSLMMLSFINHISQGVSPFPLLWLLPLSIYLISFTIAFRENIIGFKYWSLFGLFIILITSLVRTFEFLGYFQIYEQVIFYSLTLGITSIVSHHLLYKERPETERLTYFYLYISAGGALGGLLVGLVFPYLFKGLWEIEISLVAAMLIYYYGTKKLGDVSHVFAKLRTKSFLPAIIFSLSITQLIFLIKSYDKTIYVNRNFYGVVKVVEDEKLRYLYHGKTLHGSQNKSPERQFVPTTYYSNSSGAGLAFNLRRKEGEFPLRVGVIGLGVGTLASYCKENDEFVFYEINPEVVNAAKKYFSYLKNCPQANIVVGDARLSIEQRLGINKPFDILFLDAFSDDAIPIHLLTIEAFSEYINILNNDGLLAFHISNRNLDLAPVLKAASNQLNLSLILVDDLNTKKENDYVSSSIWGLLTKNKNYFIDIDQTKFKIIKESEIKKQVNWTDDYSNILEVLK